MSEHGEVIRSSGFCITSNANINFWQWTKIIKVVVQFLIKIRTLNSGIIKIFSCLIRTLRSLINFVICLAIDSFENEAWSLGLRLSLWFWWRILFRNEIQVLILSLWLQDAADLHILVFIVICVLWRDQAKSVVDIVGCLSLWFIDILIANFILGSRSEHQAGILLLILLLILHLLIYWSGHLLKLLVLLFLKTRGHHVLLVLFERVADSFLFGVVFSLVCDPFLLCSLEF